MDDPSIRNPHDRFFKETFSHLDLARPFFQNFLPPEISQALQWETLKREEGSFLDEALRECSSDLLFTVGSTGNTTVLLYCLFEHQKTPDRWMALRVLHYQVLIWRGWLKKHPRAKKLPLILPIVLYQGSRPWRASTQFIDLIQLPEDIDVASLKGLITNSGFQRIDLRDNDNVDHLTTIPLKVVLRIMRELGKPSPGQDVEGIFRTIADLPDQGIDPEYIRSCITYVFHASRKLDQKAFLKQIHDLESKPNLKENIMNIASAIVRESEARGLVKGEELGLRKGKAGLLKQQLESRFGALPKWATGRIEDASAEELERWALQVLSALSLEEVFQ